MNPPAVARLAVALLLVAAVFATATAVVRRISTRASIYATSPEPPQPSADLVLPSAPPPKVTVRHRIGQGDTLGGILTGYGVDADAVRQAALDHHDLARVRTGRDLVLVTDETGRDVVELRYALGEDDELVVSLQGTRWVSRVETTVYQATVLRREFVVESTLWDAATGAGLRPADVVTLSKVFETDIDFNTEVRAGATVEVVVEELVRDDGFTKLGSPLAVRFRNGGKTLTATRFQSSPDQAAEYYDDEGFNRRGAFLRSPLEFSRVTSSFSKGRYHPVLKKKRAHLGTDFGAPTGTPVRAIGRGKVLKAGRNGGHGNYVEVQHEGGFKTSYSHLSRILVRKGETVAQGQLVGKVGSTGLSTGPHLHYQLWVGGKIVDAMSVDLPRNERLPASAMPAFEAWRDQLRPVLDGTADPATLVIP